MKQEDRIPSLLDDLRRFGVSAKRVVARGQEKFLDPSDDEQRRIARSILVDVSTASDRLGERFRSANPQIDWAGVRATRNFVAHDYEGTDDSALWRVISESFPQMLRDLGLDD